LETKRKREKMAIQMSVASKISFLKVNVRKVLALILLMIVTLAFWTVFDQNYARLVTYVELRVSYRREEIYEIGSISIVRGDRTLICDWDGSPYIDFKHKIIYCTIPKASCSVAKNLLRKLKGFRDWGQSDKTHNPRKNGLNSLCRLSPKKATQLLNDPNYLKLVAVRDPVERLFSTYSDKILLALLRNDFQEVQFSGFSFNSNTTFEDFFERIAPWIEANPEVDAHCRPQYTFCDLEKTFPLYNAFLSRDVAKAVKYHLSKRPGNIWEKNELEKVFIQKIKHTTDSVQRLGTISLELKEKIRKLYHKDYEVIPFGELEKLKYD